MDGKLIQNNLAEATTEMGFPADVNFPLQRDVELEDGTIVKVEGITPDKMKTILNQFVDGDEEPITFLTPGEDYVKDEEVLIKGVCQAWNESIIEAELESIAITTPPTKTSYFVGETFDTTGMVVTATYSNGAKRPITDYEISPDGELTISDTTITITYEDKTATQEITIAEDTLSSIAITTPPTKTTYTEGEVFDATGMVVTGTYASGKTEVISEYTITPSTALSTTDTYVTISVDELSCTQAITVEVAPSTLTLEAGKEYSIKLQDLKYFLADNLTQEQKEATIGTTVSDTLPFIYIQNVNNTGTIETNSFYMSFDNETDGSIYFNINDGTNKEIVCIKYADSDYGTLNTVGDMFLILEEPGETILTIPSTGINDTVYLDDNCILNIYCYMNSEWISIPLTIKLSDYIEIYTGE